MPEGPEIKRAADQIAKVLLGQQLVRVEFAFEHLKPYENQLTGRTVVSVCPRGKALLTHFDNGLTIYSHNQLYGQWSVQKTPAERKSERTTPRQLRLALRTPTHAALLYSASNIEVWPTADLLEQPYLAKLGVELLAAQTTQADVLAHVNHPRFARRSLAALLLDQGFLAGIGNYLRSEILFVARLSPGVRIAQLNPARRAALAQAALELTRQSYRTKGITNDAVLAQRLKQEGWQFGAYRHWVFDRSGQSCHVCATPIVRTEISGRGLFYCPHCQP